MSNLSIKSYYPALRDKKIELVKRFPDGSCWIVPLNGGAHSHVSIDIAADCIVRGTHRLATDDEVTEFNAALTAQQARSRPATTLDRARAQFQAVMEERRKESA
jgi:hypothetical protein